MFRRMIMRVLAGVLVLRGVAASDLTIGHAHPQVHPGVAELQALLAPRRQRGDVTNLIKMRALHRRFSAYALQRRADRLQQSHGVVSCVGRFLAANSLQPGGTAPSAWSAG